MLLTDGNALGSDDGSTETDEVGAFDGIELGCPDLISLGFDDSLGWPDGASVISFGLGLLLTDGNALGSIEGATEG